MEHGRACGYCATSPVLCVLEKLVHVEDPDLLPELIMVRYEAPDSLRADTISIADLPEDWLLRENMTQQRGDDWHSALEVPLLRVPSAIVPLEHSPDMNMLINHRHPAVDQISIITAESFVLHPRLF